MLEANALETYYGESHILKGVSFHLPKGTLAALLGRNGMGKTTTIRSLIGFTPPRQGKVIFQGKEIQKLPPYHIAKLGIGLVPQGRGVFPNLSVKENLVMAARAGNRMGWNLERVYTLFPRLKEREGHLGAKLSGGEQQMLSVARALMTNPDLLLLDEPSEGLAPLIVKELANILDELKKQGLSILLVEQNMHMALGIADHVFVLNKGEIVYSGTPQQLAANKQVQAQYLGVGG
ncbi:ABC transporter ATP-binding protein [Paradesulfitobacterium aromaticivorans]